MSFGASAFGAKKFGAFFNTITQENPDIDYKYPWAIQIICKNGWLKKKIEIGRADCILKSFEFEITERGSSAGKIDFARLDFSLFTGDIINTYYKGTKIYSGIISEPPDYIKKSVVLVPRRIAFKRRYYTGIISGYVTDILKTIIQQKQSDTMISFSDSHISTEFRSKDFTTSISFPEGKDLEEIINTWVKNVDPDAVWGVNNDNIFYIAYPSDSVKKVLSLYNKDYTEIDDKPNYQDVTETRLIITYTDLDGNKQTTKVGYEDTPDYPPLSIEKEIDIIEGIYKITEKVSEETAKNCGYQKLLSQMPKNTVTIKNVNLKRYFPIPLDRIQAETRPIKRPFTLIDCKSLAGWYCATALSLYPDSITGLNSVKVSDNTFCFIHGTVGDIRYARIKGLEKVNLLIKSSVLQTVSFEFYFKNMSPEIFSFEVKAGVWQLLQVNQTKAFNIIKFYGSSAFLVDLIEAYGNYSYPVQDYIKQINLKGDSVGINCDLTLSNYDYRLNDRFLKLEKEIKSLTTGV